MADPYAFRIERTGGPEVLEAERIDVPAPGEGELLIRHEAVGLNYLDTYHRSGLYPLPLPSGIGSEAAGIVEAVGAGVQGFREGDRVGYFSGPLGSYGTHRTIDADRVVILPDAIDSETAAAAMLKGDRTLEQISDWVLAENINPKPRSGRQEYLENLVNRFV